jgi:SAM-dependent methyltransferase
MYEVGIGMMVSVGEKGRTTHNAVFFDGKTEAIARIIRERAPAPISRLLVVGCGSGIEAAILAKELNTTVVGVDLNSNFNPSAANLVDLRHGDATALEFEDATFDFVYSYHALEHIPDYRKALQEMRRVLVSAGPYCVGTPNRSRVVGYLGSKDATIGQMIAWNFADWSARARGKFRNECGAHAGFTSDELQRELQKVFGQVDEITLPYYQQVYNRHEALITALDRVGLGRLLFPSVYFMGRK